MRTQQLAARMRRADRQRRRRLIEVQCLAGYLADQRRTLGSEDQERDDHGRWASGGGGGSGGAAGEGSQEHNAWQVRVDSRQDSRDAVQGVKDKWLSGNEIGSEFKQVSVNLELIHGDANDGELPGAEVRQRMGEELGSLKERYQSGSAELKEAGSTNEELAGLDRATEKAASACEKKADAYAAQVDSVKAATEKQAGIAAEEPEEPDIDSFYAGVDDSDQDAADAYDTAFAKYETEHEKWETQSEKADEKLAREQEKLQAKFDDLTEAIDEQYHEKALGELNDAADKTLERLDAEEESDPEPEEIDPEPEQKH